MWLLVRLIVNHRFSPLIRYFPHAWPHQSARRGLFSIHRRLLSFTRWPKYKLLMDIGIRGILDYTGYQRLHWGILLATTVKAHNGPNHPTKTDQFWTRSYVMDPNVICFYFFKMTSIHSIKVVTVSTFSLATGSRHGMKEDNKTLLHMQSTGG